MAAVVFAAVGTDWLARLIDSAQVTPGVTVLLLDHQLNELTRYPAGQPALPVPRAALVELIHRQPQEGSLPSAAGEH